MDNVSAQYIKLLVLERNNPIVTLATESLKPKVPSTTLVRRMLSIAALNGWHQAL